MADASKLALEKIAPNLGVGAAAGSAAGAAIKYSAGMAPLHRLAVIGTTAAATAAGTKIGLDLGGVVSKNINIEEAIKNSPHAEPKTDRIPSPSAEPDFFIASPADITSPLQELLMYSLALDILILILLIGILLIIFNRYIVKYNLNFINNIIHCLPANGTVQCRWQGQHAQRGGEVATPSLRSLAAGGRGPCTVPGGYTRTLFLGIINFIREVIISLYGPL